VTADGHGADVESTTLKKCGKVSVTDLFVIEGGEECFTVSLRKALK